MADKIIGISVEYAQGDMRDSTFVAGVTKADIDVISQIIESTGELTVIGFSEVVRDAALIGVPFEPTGDAADKIISYKKLVAVFGDGSAVMLHGKMPSADAKVTLMATALAAETLLGKPVTEVDAGAVKKVIVKEAGV